jgi:hypothetical protein
MSKSSISEPITGNQNELNLGFSKYKDLQPFIHDSKLRRTQILQSRTI